MEFRRIAIHELVQVRSTRLAAYDGMVGVVIGIGEDEGSGSSYAVSVSEVDMVISCWHYELEGTGRLVPNPDRKAKL